MKVGDLVRGSHPGWDPTKVGIVVEDKIDSFPNHIAVKFLNRFSIMHIQDAVLIQKRDSNESRRLSSV
ncbi:MAG: hypothetical protein CL885_04540 [Dehalococcoidia bacterium]|nr:hypothetical protein [Dehalococcoidia bacterium]